MFEGHSRRRPHDPAAAAVYSHSRTRTTSSNTFPVNLQAPQPIQIPHGNPNMQFSRRSPSVNSFGATSTAPPPAAYRTSPTIDLRRSTSSRSGGASPQPTSYVAALRRQKGTVWCDRAQPEDPHIAAQLRTAKMRATQEMLGGPRTGTGYSGSGGGRTNTGISATGKVAAKIRHHGKPAVVGYTPGNDHVGVGGVPPRLSATEVEGESSEEEDGVSHRLHHRRTGSSGRSSTASRRGLNYRSSGGLGSQREKRYSPNGTPERSGSFVERKDDIVGGPSDAASGKARSTGSGSSAERADNVADLGSAARLASNSLMNSTITREKSVKSTEDLKRRGSVDERTMTLSAGRLFIANPD